MKEVGGLGTGLFLLFIIGVFIWFALALIKPGKFAPFFKEDAKRKRLKIAGIWISLSLISTILFGLSIPHVDPATLVGKELVVSAEKGKVFETPDKAGKIVKTVPKGAIRKILEGKTVNSLDWFRIADNAWMNQRDVSTSSYDIEKAKNELEKKGKGSIGKDFVASSDSAINAYDQVSGNTVGQIDPWVILTVKDFKQVGDDEFWYMTADNKWFSGKDITLDEKTVGARKKNTEEKGTNAIGKKFMPAGDGTIYAYDQPSADGNIVEKITKWRAFNIAEFKQVGVDTFWYRYASNKWVLGKDITFNERDLEKKKQEINDLLAKQAAEIKKSVEKANAEKEEQKKKQREYDAAHPVTYRAWTENDNIFSHVKVEVTNRTNSKKYVLVNVRIYTGNTVRQEYADGMEVDAKGKWLTDFPIIISDIGDYTYKIKLSY